MALSLARPACEDLRQTPGNRAGGRDDRGAHAEHPMIRTALNVISAPLLVVSIYAGFAWCITSTLDGMTRADCARGIQRACAAVEAKR